MTNVATTLLVLRGPSGCGKSTTATQLREAYGGRGLAIIRQDEVRRNVLRERDQDGAFTITLIDIMARATLAAGIPCVVEGILSARIYGPMLERLLADHPRSFAYFWDVPFERTVLRHYTKPNHHEWSVEDMRSWYTPHDLLPSGVERIIGEHECQQDAVERIVAETALLTAPRPPYATLAPDPVTAAPSSTP